MLLNGHVAVGRGQAPPQTTEPVPSMRDWREKRDRRESCESLFVKREPTING